MAAPTPRISVSSPTGQQWRIGHGRHEVVVCEVGATLRSYKVGDTQVLDGFGPDEWSHTGRGQVLAPWPNRLADGRYEFNGVRAQAALDEPERRNAIHGLVRWLPWTLQTAPPEPTLAPPAAASLSGLPVLAAARARVPRRPGRPHGDNDARSHSRRARYRSGWASIPISPRVPRRSTAPSSTCRHAIPSILTTGGYRPAR